MTNFTSNISQQEFDESEKICANSIRSSIFNLIKEDYQSFDKDSLISIGELNAYKQKYISKFILNEIGELTELEETVLDTFKDKSFVVTKTSEKDSKIKFGQRVSDKIASFGGSWTFILSFLGFLGIWILANVFLLGSKVFDPYPFILLNLLLSCVAALQAPVIMMSQNRQEEKDRERAKNDYMVNLKTELEIRLLHEKIDHITLNQQQQLIEMQKKQIELLNEIVKQVKPNK